jgi:arylsulfatase
MPAERASRVSRLADYPPVQGGASFDMSNVVEEFIEKALQ